MFFGTVQYFKVPISWYDAEGVHIVVVQPIPEEKFIMYSLIMWLIVSASSAILLFLIRIITKTQNSSVSDAYLRSLSSAIGYGNFGLVKGVHRSETILLTSILIFGVFFNIHYTEHLFESRTFGTEKQRFKSFDELRKGNVSLYHEIGIDSTKFEGRT